MAVGLLCHSPLRSGLRDVVLFFSERMVDNKAVAVELRFNYMAIYLAQRAASCCASKRPAPLGDHNL